VRISLVPVALAIGLFGCTSLPAGKPRFVLAPDAPQGYATVYFYRVGAFPKLRKPSISVGDVPVIDLPERATTWVYVKSGDRNISVHWAWDTGAPNLAFSQSFDAGQSYFIKIFGSFKMHITPGAFYAVADTGIGTFARSVSKAEAIGELEACCVFKAPSARVIQ
jgi:hypothetical protein